MPRRILTRHLASWADPARVFSALYADAGDAFWLDAGPQAGSGVSYLGAPSSTAVADDLEELLSGLRATAGRHGPILADPALPAFRLGHVGWLGYELGVHALGLPAEPQRSPRAAMMFVDRAIAFDHAEGSVLLMALEGAAGCEAWLDETEARLGALAAASVPPFRGTTPAARSSAAQSAVAHWRHSPAEYAALVERCQEYIRRGDAYQLCLTNEIRVPGRFDPLETYLALRAASPSHHGGFLRFLDVSLLSATPEQFLRVGADRVATTKPIKGTRPRGGTLARDLELRAELEASEKERAENIMIVDLMRNDLAKVARLGTVEVTSLLAVESYSSVHQLVSTVRAQLRDDADALDAVAALFPAGSMTGAPKLSAIRILNALEGGPRDVYSGVFGYFGLDGAVDLAMVIRSIVLSPDGASIGAGGGITALSVPADEVEETRIKAAPLLAALGVGPDAPPAVPNPDRAGV